MTIVSVKNFAGIDLRKSANASPANTFRELTNLQVTAGRSIKPRPGTRRIAKLSPSSVGLFSIDGNLRSVAPAGYSDIAGNPPLPVQYIYVGRGVLSPRDYYTELLAVEQYDSDTAGVAIPYMALRTSAGTIEHHYADDLASTGGLDSGTSTLVDIPFQPSAGLIKLAGRLFAASDLTGVVHFNSIVNGARDWTAEADAGFIPVANNAPGDRTIQGLSHFRQQLVVAFEDSMQLWGVDTNPDNFSLVQSAGDNLNGPGTLFPEALVNVLGDTFYLGRGGVRNLATAAVSGERQEEQGVGVKIDPIILAAVHNAEHVTAEWSQTRGQLLIAADNEIFCLTYVPRGPDGKSVVEWATWQMPFTVKSLIEAGGKLYARDTEHYVHEFDDTLTSDDAVPFVWFGRTPDIGKDETAGLWAFEDIRLSCSGTVTVYGYPDSNRPDVRDVLGVQTGVTSPFDLMRTPYISQAVGFGFEGTGPFQLDSFALNITKLSM